MCRFAPPPVLVALVSFPPERYVTVGVRFWSTSYFDPNATSSDAWGSVGDAAPGPADRWRGRFVFSKFGLGPGLRGCDCWGAAASEHATRKYQRYPRRGWVGEGPEEVGNPQARRRYDRNLAGNCTCSQV